MRGQEIVDLCNKWAAKGVLEPDAAQSIIGVVQNKSWSDFSNKVFVMLGAGAAMGPFLTLMAMGANVVAIDIDIPQVWERLLTVAQNSAGTFTFPLKKPQKDCATHKELAANAGANLIASAPEIANWIISLYPKKQLVLGSYVYLDSAMYGTRCCLLLVLIFCFQGSSRFLLLAMPFLPRFWLLARTLLWQCLEPPQMCT